MKFEWDENKRLEVLQKRGVDFVYAARIFVNPLVECLDIRQDYGEERIIAVGHFEDEFFVVVYTIRKEIRRIITAWKGGENERRQYKARFP